jgi:hypothetical protein
MNGRRLPPVAAASLRQYRWQYEQSDPLEDVRSSGQASVTTLQRTLDDDGLILVDRQQTHLLNGADADIALEVLLSETDQHSASVRIASCFNDEEMAGSAVDWQHVVDSFVCDELLVERRPIQTFDSVEVSTNAETVLTARTFHYGMTLAGMALGVYGFGMILQHRPHVRRSGACIDGDGEGFQMLPVYVLLLVVFAGFDLVCTLFTSQSGGLLELNPIGSSLLNRPIALTGLKVLATIVTAGILILLRPYRVAQVTSWWLCLALVMLTLRWVVFSSMFLA